MIQGYNAEGDTVVSILEEDSPIITISTYDAQGNKVETASYDKDKRFVHSVYTYNEKGEKESWEYQARTLEGVQNTEQTYAYQYGADGLAEKTTIKRVSQSQRKPIPASRPSREPLFERLCKENYHRI